MPGLHRVLRYMPTLAYHLPASNRSIVSSRLSAILLEQMTSADSDMDNRCMLEEPRYLPCAESKERQCSHIALPDTLSSFDRARVLQRI